MRSKEQDDLTWELYGFLDQVCRRTRPANTRTKQGPFVDDRPYLGEVGAVGVRFSDQNGWQTLFYAVIDFSDRGREFCLVFVRGKVMSYSQAHKTRAGGISFPLHDPDAWGDFCGEATRQIRLQHYKLFDS